MLVLDEPTATLVARDVERLFTALRGLKAQGVRILHVSHRLAEVRSLADRITVLRDGSVVATRPAGSSERELARLILGRDVAASITAEAVPSDSEDVLRIEGMATGPVRELDLVLRRGEVLGITGLRGAGHEHIGRALFGLQAWTGTCRLRGEPYHAANAAEALALGVAYVVGDRTRNGIPVMSVLDNLLMGRWASGPRATFRRPRDERSEAQRIVKRFDVRPPDPGRLLSELSGGNWQKVALARSLELHPDVLIMDDPTAGVDVGARAEIYRLIREYTDRGTAVLLISSDYEEIAFHASRVMVLIRGRHMATLTGTEIDASTINASAMGAVA